MPRDAEFREAVLNLLGYYQPWSGSQGQRDAALARVLALYAARDGEVCTVVDSEWHLCPIVALSGFNPGDRVRVTRYEEKRK